MLGSRNVHTSGVVGTSVAESSAARNSMNLYLYTHTDTHIFIHMYTHRLTHRPRHTHFTTTLSRHSRRCGFRLGTHCLFLSLCADPCSTAGSQKDERKQGQADRRTDARTDQEQRGTRERDRRSVAGRKTNCADRKTSFSCSQQSCPSRPLVPSMSRSTSNKPMLYRACASASQRVFLPSHGRSVTAAARRLRDSRC